ncbi:MAG: hypothetical protein RLZ98_2199 [Pseudomonadota bacterium]|jgi:mannose-6-phosphate isomerase-like protein (cupin superfamily)
MSDIQKELAPELLARIEDAEKTVVTFKYQRPDEIGRSKALVRLGRGGNVRGVVQVVKKNGGENNLHYHTNADSLWMVLKGRVRFYGAGDKLLGEFGAHEGIITPAFSRYWFENCGDEDLELLQVGAFAGHEVQSSGRTALEPEKSKLSDHTHFAAETEKPNV